MQNIQDIMGKEGSKHEFLRGKYIFFRGDIGAEFFVIQKGKVELSIFNLQGEKIVIDELGPGEYFGQTEVFINAPRSLNAFVSSRTILIGYSAEKLREKVRSDNKCAFIIIERLCQLLDKEYENLEDIFALNSYQRVSKKIYQLSINRNTNILDINQQRMSDLLALSRETTNKSLNKLKEKGAILIQRSQIRIIDDALLQKQFSTASKEVA